KAKDSVLIGQPPQLNITSGPVVGVTCFGSNTGSIQITVNGGVPGYNYSWAPSGGSGISPGTINATGLAAGTYTCNITDAHGCTTNIKATDTGPTSPLVASIGSFSNVKCYGIPTGTADVNVTGGTTPYTYNWSPSGGSGPVATTLGAGTYTCQVTDSNGCTGTATVSITQPANALTVSNDDTAICSGGTATLHASASGGTPSYKYMWSAGSTISTQVVSPTSSSTYTVGVTDANGCQASVPDIVTISPPLIQGKVTGPSPVCAGSTIILIDSVGGGVGTTNYVWSNGGTGSSVIVTPSGNTTYSVTATDGCSGSGVLGTISITIISFPSFSVCCDSTITIGQSVNLLVMPSSGYTYTWTPATGLNCYTCPNPIATPTVNTTYSVTISNGTCSTMDTVTIDIGTGKLVIYNGITPNGDGRNDTWVIDNIELYNNNSVSIYNRWGIEVWKGDNYNNSTVVWKGLNNSGQLLPDATYFYIIKTDGATYKGWVQLTR
ncbi:MAG TPA: gliding motility-associated C-terminal domain-containing protein, partial [Bacteroidia bacterium]|nr:gliding motility-associated C-terminal domain-containing protein [Bacteroidia bacterium]